MQTWAIDIEISGVEAIDTHDLEQFAMAIDDSLHQTGASASLNSITGMVSASFSGDAEDAVAAIDAGVRMVRMALAQAGLAQVEPTRVVAEQIRGGDLPRVGGQLRGKILISPDFDDPLPEFEKLFYS